MAQDQQVTELQRKLQSLREDLLASESGPKSGFRAAHDSALKRFHEINEGMDRLPRSSLSPDLAGLHEEVWALLDKIGPAAQK